MPGNVQSVERAAAILRLLADEDEPLALAQVAAALGLAKPTAHGILRTLEDVGFVEQDVPNGPYRVAADLFHLGRGEKLDPNELRSRAMNWTDALAARTGESARVATFLRGRAEVAHHVFRADGGTQVLMTGSIVPLHASALGKVLLAFYPGAARSVLRSELPALPVEQHAPGRRGALVQCRDQAQRARHRTARPWPSSREIARPARTT